MMIFAFDLISDLHVDTWPKFDWTGIATSPVAIVVGDIARDRNDLVEVLTHLGRNYQAVFYVDGNDEHTNYLNDLHQSYADLVSRIKRIPKIVYLQDNVVVVDGVAILGTNGWWGFDFDLSIDPTQSAQWYQEKFGLTTDAVKTISRMATTDAMYMVQSVKRLQTHKDVKKIILVTHTVPDPILISHDLSLANTWRFNTMGNRYMRQVFEVDTEHKIHTWCFGHYHNSVDQVRDGVQYLNHCRGRGNTDHGQHVYYPRRIIIDV